MSDGVNLLYNGSREPSSHRKEMSAKARLGRIGWSPGNTFPFEDIFSTDEQKLSTTGIFHKNLRPKGRNRRSGKGQSRSLGLAAHWLESKIAYRPVRYRVAPNQLSRDSEHAPLTTAFGAFENRSTTRGCTGRVRTRMGAGSSSGSCCL